MFLTMVLCYCDLLFGLYPSSLCFATTTFQGMVLPLLSGETYSVGSGRSSYLYRLIEASSIDPTEEPSLETVWFQNIRTMDKVQIIDCSNSFPSFIVGETEPQLLIKLYIFAHCRVLATCFMCNVVNITYTVCYQTLNHCVLV
jgi:hypothetical protein